ncbi:MAG TPA: MauE/DoxX family redox-associated membrane protein [Chthoniobacterales bacterium]|jgi:uncharacterized membrane protein YphA (DoxX/SURF4 family)
MRIAIWAARILLAAIFFYAGVVKLGTSERFAITVADFSILPPALLHVVVPGLPWLEAFAAVLLVIPRTARLGAGIVAVLLVTFIAALAWALNQGIVVDCGCFGEESQPSTDQMVLAIWRDVALLALTLGLAIRRSAGRPARNPDTSQKTPASGADR